jgi:hypothetical protein
MVRDACHRSDPIVQGCTGDPSRARVGSAFLLRNRRECNVNVYFRLVSQCTTERPLRREPSPTNEDQAARTNVNVLAADRGSRTFVWYLARANWLSSWSIMLSPSGG